MDSGFQISSSAPHYYERVVGQFMKPFVEALVAVGVAVGDSVLDVACGTGFATRAAASAAGQSGTMVGSDINASMLEVARRVSVGAHPGIDWREASALDLPYVDEEFDSVICQQGIQFFPDVGGGLREMARVVRSGGRLSATVWTKISESPLIAAETTMLIKHGIADPDSVSQAFPAGGAEQIHEWFEEAGLGSVEIESIEAVVSLPSVHDFVPDHLHALPWSDGFFDLDPATQRSALDDLTDELVRFRTKDGLAVPFTSYVATLEIRH